MVGVFCSRQDDKPVPPCYQPAMEWIIAIALAVGVLVLAAVFVLRAMVHSALTMSASYNPHLAASWSVVSCILSLLAVSFEYIA